MNRVTDSPRRLVILASLLAALLAVRGTAAEHTRDSLEAVLKSVQEGKAVLLNVREQSEWDGGHLRWAVHLPLSRLREIDAESLARVLPKDKAIYCHCAAGVRVLPRRRHPPKTRLRRPPPQARVQGLAPRRFPEGRAVTTGIWPSASPRGGTVSWQPCGSCERRGKVSV